MEKNNNPEEKKFKPQALRIKEFIHVTGLTHTEFGRQCGFKSARTVQSIYTDGKAPTDKALNKIVQRFPQLNYDWVLMGIGEMINQTFNKNISPISNEKSTKSGFQQIQKKLTSHDLNLNELSVDVEKMIKTTETNMLVYTQSMAVITNKVEAMSNALNELKDKQTDLQNYHIEATAKVFEKYDSDMKENEALIRRLDKERKELALKLHEDRKKLNRDFWDEITEDFDKKIEGNWKRYEQKMIDTNTHFDGLMVDLNKKLDTNTQTAINMITDSGKDNTAKALKALGEHSLNINPKHQK